MKLPDGPVPTKALHVGVAEDICIHLYGRGHAKYYTKKLIAQALAAAEARKLVEFVETLITPKEGA